MPPALHKVTKKEKDYNIIFKLGSSYFQLHDFRKAQSWFKKIKDSNIACFYYAICLRANGEYNDASKYFSSFMLSHTANDYYNVQANNELKNLRFITEQLGKEDSSVIIQKIYDNIETSDYALTLKDTNTAVITSTRLDSELLQSNLDPYLNQLYTVTINDKALSISGKLDIPVEKNIQQGTAAFTPDGNKLFFTKWYKTINDTIAAIYVTEKKNNKWSSPVKLNNNINVDGYKSIQPFITRDGKQLIFASNKPGGIGKYDLWYASLDSNYEPGIAINLGAVINTSGNEEAPFYQLTNNTLTFSSDARVGMGGFDLYESKGNFIEWDSVINLGYPVNSSKDDIYFYCSGKDSVWNNAYLSSDRASECCLQLFSIEKIKPNIHPAIIISDSANKNIIVNPKPEEQTINDSNNYATIIYFEFNSSSIVDSSHPILDSLSKLLNTDSTLTAEIAGYTDGIGSTEYNLKLSDQRALSCKKYLLGRNVNEHQLYIHFYGKCCPVSSEKLPSGKDNPLGRQKNRRVELKILFNKP